MLSEHPWCTHLWKMLAYEQTDKAVGFDREHDVVEEHGSRIQAPDRPRNGLAREVFWRMWRWWVGRNIPPDPGHIVFGKSCVILVPERFPSRELVVHHVRIGRLAALNHRRIV